MKAPDKIYTDNRGVYAELPIFSQIDASVEYIRKDALMEWVKEELASYAEEIYSTDHYEDGCKDVLRQIIDKLNEM